MLIGPITLKVPYLPLHCIWHKSTSYNKHKSCLMTHIRLSRNIIAYLGTYTRLTAQLAFHDTSALFTAYVCLLSHKFAFQGKQATRLLRYIIMFPDKQKPPTSSPFTANIAFHGNIFTFNRASLLWQTNCFSRHISPKKGKHTRLSRQTAS